MGFEYQEVAEKGMAAYRAPSLTQPHRARQAIRDAYDGKINPLIGYYCGISTVPTARVMAQLGADVVWVDWEHSSCGVETMTSVSMLPYSGRLALTMVKIVHEIQFMSEGKTMAFVRYHYYSLWLPFHDTY